VNHKRLFRLYREERLGVRRRGGRKRAIGTRAPMAIPQGPNQRWSVDFLQDVLSDGRRFRVFAVRGGSYDMRFRVGGPRVLINSSARIE
jgi:putative transposase